MRDYAGVLQWAKDNPTNPTTQSGTWDEWCEAFVYRAGGFTESYPSAFKAYQSTMLHSGGLDTRDSDLVPAGWLYYWDIAGPNNGHIGFANGDGNCLMANHRVQPLTPAHKALGFLRAKDYTRLSGARYLGASPSHGRQTLTVPTIATPAPAEVVNIPLWVTDERNTKVLFLIAANDAEGRWGKPAVHYALTGVGYWVEVKTIAAANNLALRFGNASNVTYEEWDNFKTASGFKAAA